MVHRVARSRGSGAGAGRSTDLSGPRGGMRLAAQVSVASAREARLAPAQIASSRTGLHPVAPRSRRPGARVLCAPRGSARRERVSLFGPHFDERSPPPRQCGSGTRIPSRRHPQRHSMGPGNPAPRAKVKSFRTISTPSPRREVHRTPHPVRHHAHSSPHLTPSHSHNHTSSFPPQSLPGMRRPPETEYGGSPDPRPSVPWPIRLAAPESPHSDSPRQTLAAPKC